MQRRNFLQLLAAVPFVGRMAPKPKEEVEEVPPIDGPEYTERTERQREITRVYLDNYYSVINPKHSHVLEANDPTNPEV